MRIRMDYGWNLFLLGAYFFCSIGPTVAQGPTIAQCPKYQVPHTHRATAGTVCCKPVLHCPVGWQINFCTFNGGSDTCVRCPPGWSGTYVTSSLDVNPERCFRNVSDHAKCALDDNAWVESYLAKHGMPCRCDEARCYYGSPSEAGCMYKQCDDNFELDHYTGDCKPCGPFKNRTGTCSAGVPGVCLVNEAAWRLSEELKKAFLPSSPHTASSRLVENATEPSPPTSPPRDAMETTITPSNGNDYTIVAGDVTPATAPASKTSADGEGNLKIIVAIVVVLVVVIGISVAVVLYILKRKLERNDERSCLVRWYRRCPWSSKPVEAQSRVDEETSFGVGQANGDHRVTATVKPYQEEQGPSNGHGAHNGNCHAEVSLTCVQPLLGEERGASAADANVDETKMKTP